uniref:Uncharacterized protein n=1 Tax=Helminthora furcellata TaxID=1884666 RepID=A0A1G4NRC3_9FLOR|nr:Hypothetical protein ycf58 [Helminthora furcellata]SCW21126.1 Hypothetical protein ycf58 [Helminthora furcellata]SCW23986.1 Hypothetical protein ycf58 [Helminthora furcellata]
MSTKISLDLAKLNSGKWVTLRTSYFINSNIMDIHRSTINLDNIDSNIHSFHNQQIYILRNNTDINITNVSYSLTKPKDILDIQLQSLDNWSNFNNKSNHTSFFYTIDNLELSGKSWFVNPNLRINIDRIYKNNKCICVSFSSDIKIV